MKPISNGFKDALKNIKQIDAIISYADRENTNYIITQNSEFLLTEAQDFLVTESDNVRIDNGGIQNCSIYWNTDVFKSVCKMLDLETSIAIPKGTEINVKVGIKVGNDFEYIDYGKFYVNEEPQYNLDTRTYSTTCYDKMISFNIKASENPLTFEEGTTYTLKQYLEMICEKCGVLYSFDFSNVINDGAQIIDSDPYLGNKEVTYRDILDDIAECLGTNFIINANNRIANKEILLMNNITIVADIIRDTNVYVGEKKDPIDGIQVYDGSTMINYAGEGTSVLKIRNNNIMSTHSTDLIEGVLSMIRDFYYYTYKLETFGILALEPFDCFTVSYNNTNYLLCSFHNEINITTGISEEISYEFSEEDNVNEYTTASSEDKLKDAYIEIDKANAKIDINAEAIDDANAQIVLKANSNGRIVKAELSADPSSGSNFTVKADNINLEGYTTINNRFKVDTNGYMSCAGASVTDGSLEITSTNSYPKVQIKDGTYKILLTGTDLTLRQGNNDTIEMFSVAGGNGKIAIFSEFNTTVPSIELDGWSGGVICEYVEQTSLAEKKKNIEKLNNGLDIIKNIDIYKYHLINQDEGDKKHIGFVIGDKYKYAKEITSNDNNGVDTYSFVSVCCKAIQEQQEQIEKMQDEINSLKEMINNGK